MSAFNEEETEMAKYLDDEVSVGWDVEEEDMGTVPVPSVPVLTEIQTFHGLTPLPLYDYRSYHEGRGSFFDDLYMKLGCQCLEHTANEEPPCLKKIIKFSLNVQRDSAVVQFIQNLLDGSKRAVAFEDAGPHVYNLGKRLYYWSPRSLLWIRQEGRNIKTALTRYVDTLVDFFAHKRHGVFTDNVPEKDKQELTRAIEKIWNSIYNESFITRATLGLYRKTVPSDHLEPIETWFEVTPHNWLPFPDGTMINLLPQRLPNGKYDLSFPKKYTRSRRVPLQTTINYNFTYDPTKTDEENFSTAPDYFWKMSGHNEKLRRSIIRLLFTNFLGQNVDRMFYIVFGVGKQGKSLTFLKLMQKLLGPKLFIRLHPSMICERAKSSHTNFDSNLDQVYGGVLSDPPGGSKIDIGVLKTRADKDDEQDVRNAYAEESFKMRLRGPLGALYNTGKIEFNEPIEKADTAVRDRLFLLHLPTVYVPKSQYDALSKEEQESGLYQIALPESIYLSDSFCQGLLNYIIVYGRQWYIEAKSISGEYDQEEKIFKFDQKLFEMAIRENSTEFGDWIDNSIVEDPESKAFLSDLADLYREQGNKIDEKSPVTHMRNLVKKSGRSLEIAMTSRNRKANQYYIVGHRILGIREKKSEAETKFHLNFVVAPPVNGVKVFVTLEEVSEATGLKKNTAVKELKSFLDELECDRKFVGGVRTTRIWSYRKRTAEEKAEYEKEMNRKSSGLDLAVMAYPATIDPFIRQLYDGI